MRDWKDIKEWKTFVFGVGSGLAEHWFEKTDKQAQITTRKIEE